MAEVKFSEFDQSVDVADPDEVVGLKNGANTRFPSSQFKGEKGDTGATGPAGADGAKGDQGDPGPTGSTGPQGDKGDKGDTGDQGIQGVPGNDGADGADGAAATADAGVTTTLAAGSNATVTNVGTTSAAVFDFGIPQGVKGDPGSGYVIQGDASVAELNAMTATSIVTNNAWVMLDAGTVQPIGSPVATPCTADDLLIWGEGDYFVNVGPISAVSVHADLTGLSADDHLQYHTDTRGDARYYTKTQADTNYATAAQGATADTATQPGDNVSTLTNDAGYITAGDVPADAVSSVFTRTGAVVAQSGDYAAFYATTAQGALADSATQPGDNVSTLTNDAGYMAYYSGATLPDPATYAEGELFLVTA